MDKAFDKDVLGLVAFISCIVTAGMNEGNIYSFTEGTQCLLSGAATWEEVAQKASEMEH